MILYPFVIVIHANKTTNQFISSSAFALLPVQKHVYSHVLNRESETEIRHRSLIVHVCLTIQLNGKAYMGDKRIIHIRVKKYLVLKMAIEKRFF